MADIFIGRQPIFDQDMNVYAYELLFRKESGSFDAEVTDGDSATSQVVLNTFVNIGLENLVGPHKAFINFTRTFISTPDLISLPPDQVVIEVLEDIEPTETVINTLKNLKEQGHTIALDDFVYDSKFEPLVELADIIKIDIMALDNAEIEQHVKKLKTYNLKLLAEKVETHEEFEFLKTLGFDYYQGYFFSKPSIVQGKSITPNQLTLLELVAKINNPDIEIEELSDIISLDVSLSHKVLKFINSPMSALRSKVESVQQAVVLIGINTIKNWATLLAMATGSTKPTELSTTALIRARSCQLLAKSCHLPKPDSFFTVGLFSTLDAMMDQPLDVLINELPLAEETMEALIEYKGDYGKALQCSMAMERGDFSQIGFGELNMTELSDIYLQSIQWSDELTLEL